MAIQALEKETGSKVYCVGSDGDARRRRAFISLFNSYALKDEHPALYEALGEGDFYGLDLSCGKDGIHGTFDWRHEVKRIATLLRRAAGMKVMGVTLTPEIWKKFIRLKFPKEEVSDIEMTQVFWPEDAQNVGRATQLLELIVSLLSLSKEQVPEKLELHFGAVIIVATMFFHIRQAYFSPSLSADGQLVSIGAAATINMILAERGGSSYAPPQLVYDLGAAFSSAYHTA